MKYQNQHKHSVHGIVILAHCLQHLQKCFCQLQTKERNYYIGKKIKKNALTENIFLDNLEICWPDMHQFTAKLLLAEAHQVFSSICVLIELQLLMNLPSTAHNDSRRRPLFLAVGS